MLSLEVGLMFLAIIIEWCHHSRAEAKIKAYLTRSTILFSVFPFFFFFHLGWLEEKGNIIE